MWSPHGNAKQEQHSIVGRKTAIQKKHTNTHSKENKTSSTKLHKKIKNTYRTSNNNSMQVIIKFLYLDFFCCRQTFVDISFTEQKSTHSVSRYRSCDHFKIQQHYYTSGRNLTFNKLQHLYLSDTFLTVHANKCASAEYFT